MVRHPTVLLKRSLIFVHRWLGVALAVVFLLWFVSGIVMMYWGFPEVTASDRLQRAPVLEPSRIRVPPEQAYAALQRDWPVGEVLLSSFDGRPVYRFGPGDPGDPTMVYADDGTVQRTVDDALLDRVAARWTGRPLHEATKTPVLEVDQWTVAIGVNPLAPLHKYSWPDGQQVYVNGRTAGVAQYTTTTSRFWAYLGAVPHWLYFTPLRERPEWFSVVVWSSLAGTMAALMGVAIALWMYSPHKRYRHAGAPTSIPYRGWKRWHMVTGLFFGVVTTTWAFSGLLSMGPFPIMNRLTELTVAPSASDDSDRMEEDLSVALMGREEFQLALYAGKPAADAIRSVPDFEVKQLEYTSFAGEPVYLATDGRGATRAIPVNGAPRATLADDIMRIVRRTAGSSLAELRLMTEYDVYYLDRRGQRPLPVVFARLNDTANTRLYVDPRTGRIVGSYDASEWVTRWLYHGLHSLDFPWLYRYRPLWDIVVITLMLGGTAISVTSLVLAWRILARKLAALVAVRLNAPDEDLAVDT
jgi:hypothetical protein